MKKGRFGEAGDALRQLRMRPEVVEAEVTLMQNVIDNGNSQVVEDDLGCREQCCRYFVADFKKKSLRVLFLTTMHCIVGISIIAKFIPYILTKTIFPRSFNNISDPMHRTHNNGTNTSSQNSEHNTEGEFPLFLCVLGIANIFMLFSICTTAKSGNRPFILLSGSAGLSVAGILLCLLELGYISSSSNILLPIYLFATILYVVSYALTWGPITWSLSLEYLDLLNRGFGFGISWSISWIFSMFFSIATVYFEFGLHKTHNSSNFGTLLILISYTVTNVVAVIIVYIFYKNIPEGKVLEEIEEDYYDNFDDMNVKEGSPGYGM